MDATGYISRDELFHFCGRTEADDDARYRLLVDQILAKGALRHPPFSDGGGFFGYKLTMQDGVWVGSLAAERQGPKLEHPMFENILCFCDIPREQLGLHMQKYSRFGLSFDRKMVADRGGRPVMYIPHWPGWTNGAVSGLDALASLEARIREVTHPEYGSADMARDFLMKFIAFLKPYDVTLPLDHIDCYYTEREWRMIGYLEFAPIHVLSVNMPATYHAEFQRDRPDMAHLLHAT